MHVEEPPLAYGGGELYYGLPEPDSERIQKMLDDVRPRDPAVPFTHRLTMGDPAGEIVRIAADERAEAIVRRAPCPVLVYREAAERLARKPQPLPA